MNPQNHIGKLILLLCLALSIAAHAQTDKPSKSPAPTQAGQDTQPIPKWKQELADKLNQIILPQIEFKDANLPDVVKVLNDKIREIDRLHGGGLSVNIEIVDLPKDLLKKGGLPSITLNMRNAPIRDVLRQATDMAGVSYFYDRRGIVISHAHYLLVPPQQQQKANP